jgi:hypothetical protein
MVAIVKKRLVYAKSISEVAENNNAGVSMCSVMICFDFSKYVNILASLFTYCNKKTRKFLKLG